jgi:hypothetical protein
MRLAATLGVATRVGDVIRAVAGAHPIDLAGMAAQLCYDLGEA